MANDKKFIVKNGLQTNENVLIGTDTDNGVNKLQVSGTSVFTSDGGSAVIASFVGDNDSLNIFNVSSGDYKITNSGQNNGFVLYDMAGGVEVLYNDVVDLEFNSAGIDFKRAPTYLGNQFWRADNDGAGSGLDADLLDGLDSLQFVRADEDDTLDGNYTITGNLTVQGTTTTVNSEQVLIADNLLTLNSNFTTGTPTENAGWEVLRGDESVSSLQWDETNDWFKLISDGTDLGRIITTADEGAGNGFDADTVDGLHGSQFLRSDANDTATGNLTFEGSVTIGNNVGGAYLYFDGQGGNGTLYSRDSEIGFLAPDFQYAARLNSDENWQVEEDILAKQLTDIEDTNYFVKPSGLSELSSANFYSGDTTNDLNIGRNVNERFNVNVSDGQGYIRYYQDETDNTDHSVNFEIVTTGNGTNRFNFNSDVFIGANNLLSTGLGFFGSVYASIFYDSENAGYFANFADTGNSINIAGTIEGGNGTNLIPTYAFGSDTNTGMYRSGENVLAFTAGGNNELNVRTTYVEATGSFRAPAFYDTDNTAYVGNFAGTSQMNQIDIDTNIRHRGDTTTYIGFPAANRFNVVTNNIQRLNVDNDSADFTVNVYAPRYYDSNNAAYYLDPAADSELNTINLDDYIQHRGDLNTRFGFQSNDIFAVDTNGVTRFTIGNTAVTSALDVYAPAVYINDYLYHNNDTNTYIGFDANDQFGVWTGGTKRVNVTTSAISLNSNTTVTGDLTATGRAVLGNSLTRPDSLADLSNSHAKIGGSDVHLHIASLSPVGGYSVAMQAGRDSDDANFELALNPNGGYVGVGLLNPTSPLSVRQEATFGSNPFAASNRIMDFGDTNSTDFRLAGDQFGHAYLITDNNFVIYDGSANGKLAVLSSGSVIVNGDGITYAQSDATPTNGSIAANKLHVNGSLALTGANDAIVLGNGTSSYLKMDELGFGFGGGLYMTEATTMYVRGNKSLYTTGNVYGGRFYDSGNNAYYVDPAGDSQFKTIDIDDYIRHRGDTNNYFGFAANDTFRVWTDGTQRLNIDNDSADFAQDISTPNVYASRYYDSGNNAYYVDAAGDSQFNTIDIDDYIRHRGDTNNYFGFAANDTFRVWTDGTQRLNIDTNSIDFAVQAQGQNGTAALPAYSFSSDSNTGMYRGAADQLNFSAGGNIELEVHTQYVSAPGSMRSPVFYDLNNTAYYGDFGGTSLMNVVRANQYQLDGTAITIDTPTGNYGSIKVTGAKAGWAGYAINDDWVFMSDGPNTAGIFNDTDNEWSFLARRNAEVELFYNGVIQAETRNGWFQAQNQMRAPIYYDSDNTAFYADMAGQNRLKSIKVGDSAINNNTTYPLEIKSAQRYLVGMQNTGADANYPWLFHETRNSRSTFGIHFNGVADRFWFEENGNFQAYGAGIFGSLALNGGNEDLGLLKTYGSGLGDMKMFDATEYWDKRVIQPMQGSENNATDTTSEYTKNNNGPFASTYALRSNAYRTFDSDYIPVESGEEIYLEQAVRLISGSGGLFYLGIRRYDKDKRAIATNDGITYFAASAANVTSTGWTTFSGHHTLPTSHTAFSGSDGGPVKYVRIISLMNYSTGGAVREFGPPVLRRTNALSRIRTNHDVYAPRYYDYNDNGYYGDFASTSRMNTISANLVDSSNFRDRDNTAYYMNPASGGKVAGTWDFTNGNINNVNKMTFNDPGASEGIEWNGGNEWQIYESPDNLTNAGGNLQFTSGTGNGTRRLTLNTSGDAVVGRYVDAYRFRDRDNTAYYVEPASTSVMNEIYVNDFIRHNGDTNTYIRFQAADDMQLVAGGRQMLRMAEGSDPDRLRFVTDSDWTDSSGNWAMSGNITVSGISYALQSARSPIFYDQDNTAYYGNFGATSRMDVINANMYSLNDGWDIYDDDSNTLSIRSNNSDNGEIIFRDSNSTDCGRIYFDDDAHWGLKTPSNEWAYYIENNARTYMYYNGTWEGRTASGYFEARGSFRAPIFYDINNTAYYTNQASTSNHNIQNVQQLSVATTSTFNGILYADNPQDYDSASITALTNAPISTRNRDINVGTANAYLPLTHQTARYTSGYRTHLNTGLYKRASGWGDNDTGWYAALGGNDSFPTMTWKLTYGTDIYNSNGYVSTPNEFRAPRFADRNNSAYYMEPEGITNIGGSNDIPFRVSKTSGANNTAALFQNLYGDNSWGIVSEFRIANSTSGTDRPSILFSTAYNADTWSVGFGSTDSNFRIKTDHGHRNGGWGTSRFEIDRSANVWAYGSMRSPIFYDQNNTGYYTNPASTSVMNTLDIRGEVYNDGWFRNDTNGRGLYNTVTGQHFYSDNDDYWNVAGGGSANGIRFRDDNASTIRGYVYADNGNNIGFLNQSGSWALRTNSGTTEVYGDLYANIMYDRNSTGYYINPASTSVLNEVRVNEYIRHNSDTDSYLRFIAADDVQLVAGGRQMLRMDEGTNPDRLRFVTDSNWTDSDGDWAMSRNISVGGIGTAVGSWRAPIFYDTNNTGRYVDPASTSQLSTIEWDQLNARDRGDFITFYGDNSTYHSISSRNNTGGIDDDIRINTYGSLWINLDSNNNNTSGADFYIGRHGNATGTIANSDIFRVYGDALYAYSAFSFRAPIFYDSNNTGYYCDPASFSNFNSGLRGTNIYARDWFRNDNSNEGLYNQATGVHIYSNSGQYGAVGGNNNNSSISLRLYSSHNGTHRMWMHGGSDGYWGHLNSGGQWQLRTRYGDGYSPNLQFREEGNESWTGNPGNDVGKIEYHSNRFYIVAGGNSNRIVQFRRNGSDRSYVDNNGLYVGTATSARWADLAERYSADEMYPNATVMGINLDGDSEVTKWEPGMPLAGVISTNPAVQMNDMGIEPGCGSIKDKMNPFIALKGRIPCLVVGEVRKGQWLVPAGDGKAKGVDYGTPGINSYEIIGIALGDSENGEVEVKV
jgi:hypothetical protein